MTPRNQAVLAFKQVAIRQVIDRFKVSLPLRRLAGDPVTDRITQAIATG